MFTALRKQYYLTHKTEEIIDTPVICKKDLSQKQCYDIYNKFHCFLKNKVSEKTPVIYKRGKTQYTRYVDKITNFVGDDQLELLLSKLKSNDYVNVGYITMINSIDNATRSSNYIVIPSEFIMVSICKIKDFEIIITDPRIWKAFSEYSTDKKFEYVKDLIYS